MRHAFFDLSGAFIMYILRMKFNLTILLLASALVVHAQVFTNKEVGKKNAAKVDELKLSEYPYSLPILGAKATKAGYSLPYSAGFSTQYFWQESDLVIDNLQVGFNNGPLYNIDEVIRFTKAKAIATAFTVRPDIWLFPFLNIYGIFGTASASTDIGFTVGIPGAPESELISAATKVDFATTTFGFGLTPTIGVAGGFLALDMNTSWTDVPQLSKPARTFIFGPRMGKVFKLKKADQNLAFWVGGFRVHINSETNGSLNLGDIFDPTDFEAKIAAGFVRAEDAQQQLDNWWDNLTPPQQKNPGNVARYELGNKAIAGFSNVLVAAETAVNNVENATVQYSMDKRPLDAWNFIVGSQFQLNKHLMIRMEYGFLSSRTQFMGGIQYRFGL